MWGANAGEAAEVSNFKLLKLDGSFVRWRNENATQAPVVSYAIVTETREFKGARNCRKLTSFDGLAVASQLSEEVVRREIDGAFAMWQGAANSAFDRPTGRRQRTS